ncbi:hypothetical protein ACEPAF_6032 [Sanghuangporus sanghuang]
MPTSSQGVLGCSNHDTLDRDASSRTNCKASSKAPHELKLIYRILRLISDWALSGFFSEVCVEGVENVESEGALILMPCHHNEIIDIATLSATVPHRRIIAYWTKASLFRNPVSRFILKSAGSIPVARVPRPKEAEDNVKAGSPNGFSNGFATALDSSSRRGPNGQQALFDATYKELAKAGGGVLGVFPEGTSYTLPRIVQVKEGAARAVLGYTRWMGNRRGYGAIVDSWDSVTSINVVPVAIVYTDKSRYRSRVYVKYGRPIDLRPFVDHCLLSNVDSRPNEGSAFQEAVRRLTEEIEKRMLDLTINTANWETLYAVKTSRAILWPNEQDLPLKEFVKVSKTIVVIFEHPTIEIAELKGSLLRYHALLYHTDLTHAALDHVPLPATRQNGSISNHPGCIEPSRKSLSTSSLVKLATGLPSLALPLLLSLPTHLAHTPSYALALLTSRTFAGAEEEARAQYKAIFGGLGRVLGTFSAGFVLVQTRSGKAFLHAIGKAATKALKSCFGMAVGVMSNVLPLHGSESLEEIAEKCMGVVDSAMTFVHSSWSRLGGLGDWIGAFGVAWLLIVWHARIIDTNYIRYKRVRATLAILRAFLFPCRNEVTEDELRPYLATPPPPINPFIAKSLQTFSKDAVTTAGTEVDVESIENARETQRDERARSRISKSTLVRHLLPARADAVVKLRSTFRDLARRDRSEDLLVPHGEVTAREGRGKTVPYTTEDIDFLRECGAAF